MHPFMQPFQGIVPEVPERSSEIRSVSVRSKATELLQTQSCIPATRGMMRPSLWTPFVYAGELMQLGARLESLLQFRCALPEGPYTPASHTSHNPSCIGGWKSYGICGGK